MTEDVFSFTGEEGPWSSTNTASKKRKHVEEDSKVRRKKAKQIKRAAIAADAGMVQDEQDIDETHQVNKAISRMDGTLFADHMARAVKRFEPKLSTVELEDLRIPQSAFADTTGWASLRTQDNMPQFLESVTGLSRRDLTAAPKEKGAPHTLVVCSAAIRAADVTRALRCYQSKQSTVAKLFAKHIKLADAIKFIKTAKISVGVGTAQRINDLINEGALSTSHLRRIIVDGSWCGPKKRTLFEQTEAAVPTVKLLAREDMKSRYHSQETSILVF